MEEGGELKGDLWLFGRPLQLLLGRRKGGRRQRSRRVPAQEGVWPRWRPG